MHNCAFYPQSGILTVSSLFKSSTTKSVSVWPRKRGGWHPMGHAVVKKMLGPHMQERSHNPHLCLCEHAITWPFSLLSCPGDCHPKIWGQSQFLEIFDNLLLLHCTTLYSVNWTLHITHPTLQSTYHTSALQDFITQHTRHSTHCSVHTENSTLNVTHTTHQTVLANLLVRPLSVVSVTVAMSRFTA